MGRLYVFLFLLAVLCGCARSRDIILENNGYKNILVGIGRGIKENATIVERIKDIFAKASDRLFRATRQRAYFKEVFILVPTTWFHNATYKLPEAGQSFETANLRIDQPNPVWGNNPYTKQLGGCGEQGEYTHLTPEYILNLNETKYRWGLPEKSVVHEWGHLRWGLFDEYPIDQEADNHFYQTGTKLNPVRCTDDVRGRPLNSKTFKRCAVDRKTLQVEKDCRFYPDLANNNVKASHMYMQFLDSVQDFCDDGTLGDPDIIHNPKAPNKQNRMCEGKSAWEVMRQHEDFKNNNNPPVEGNPVTKPTFHLVQKESQMIVLLLDVSSSMLLPDEIPLTLLIQAARHYILKIIEDGTKLSIVTFAKSIKVKANLTTITSQEDRQKLLTALPTKDETEGATALRAGLEKAMMVLTDNDRDVPRAKGSKIIVFSDGSYTGSDPTTLLNDELVPRGIVIDTIAYSESADKALLDLAVASRGMSFFISSDLQSSGIFDALDAIGTSESTTSKTAPVTVDSSAVRITKGIEANGNFFIDSTIGKNTQLTFNYVSGTGVDVQVTSPSGKVFDKTSKSYKLNTDVKQVEIDLQETAEEGEWKYKINSEEDNVVMVHVLSTAKGEGAAAEPIRVKSFFGGKEPVLKPDAVAQLPVFAQVTRGYAPVIGLNVNAMIEGDSTKILVPLQDKGIAPDATADDGVYSGAVTRHLINKGGRYNLRVNVDNANKGGKIATGGGGSGALFIPRNITEDKPAEVTYEDVGSIQRVATAGQLSVTAVEDEDAPVKDLTPPPRITDLSVVRIAVVDALVTLTWTAVGDDVSPGNETTYDLRIGSFDQISNNFTVCQQIDLKDPPKLLGVQETRTINMTNFERNQTYYLAIRAIDKALNKGSSSNVVSVVLALPQQFASGETVAFVDEVPRSDGSGRGTPTGTIVAVVCVLVVLVVVAALAAVYFVRKRNRTTDEEKNDVIYYDNRGAAISR